jgi:hypothetical protein
VLRGRIFIMSHRQWSSPEKWTAVISIVTLVLCGIFIPIFLPEIRIALHLDKPHPPPATAPPPKAPPIFKYLPLDATAPSQIIQHSRSVVSGNANVAGNNVAGNGNVTGNNNQTAPIIVEPGSIGITGGIVTNPTVNNFGSPPLPTPNVRVCVSPSQVDADKVYTTKITLNTDVQITRPWVFFFFDGPVEKGSFSMPKHTFSCGCPMRAEKMANPERSMGFRLNTIDMGASNIWFPNDGPIEGVISSKTSVTFLKALAGGGESSDAVVKVNLLYQCD